MSQRLITSQDCIAEGCDWLAAREPRFAAALAQVGQVPLRRKAAGFGALLSAIIGQQVSVASANAIWARLEAAGYTDRAALAAVAEDDLRALGLSRQKARYASALARSDLTFEALDLLGDDALVARLTRLAGIGRWTAEIYAIFALGRADVFAANDLALQEAARILFALEARPTEKQLRQMAQDWSPWRAVAARLLWSYYHVAKQREGIR